MVQFHLINTSYPTTHQEHVFFSRFGISFINSEKKKERIENTSNKNFNLIQIQTPWDLEHDDPVVASNIMDHRNVIQITVLYIFFFSPEELNEIYCKYRIRISSTSDIKKNLLEKVAPCMHIIDLINVESSLQGDKGKANSTLFVHSHGSSCSRTSSYS